MSLTHHLSDFYCSVKYGKQRTSISYVTGLITHISFKYGKQIMLKEFFSRFPGPKLFILFSLFLTVIFSKDYSIRFSSYIISSNRGSCENKQYFNFLAFTVFFCHKRSLSFNPSTLMKIAHVN